LHLRSTLHIPLSIVMPPIPQIDPVRVGVLQVGSGSFLQPRTNTTRVHRVSCEALGQACWVWSVGVNRVRIQNNRQFRAR
jgi:hypothetical protein